MSKKGGGGKASASGDEGLRIAIVDPERCKPKKCGQECKRKCPVVALGKRCVEVEPTSAVSNISESLCIGCGICVKKCPFQAIQIINLPKNLDKETTHRYGENAFKLHRLPMLKQGQVLGLVGKNGIGKSTAMKILGGKLKPNLGRYANPPEWHEIVTYFRGSELQNYFTKFVEDKIRISLKPQYVDRIPRTVKGKVGDILKSKDERDVLEKTVAEMDLKFVLDRDVEALSGGELQRFAIATVLMAKSTCYMFDEPSSYLDVRQRVRAARSIRALLDLPDPPYVLTIDHDLAVQDYLSDFICVLYGTPGAYGVVCFPSSVRDGINIFLAGYIPTENLRFRESALTFKIAQNLMNNRTTAGGLEKEGEGDDEEEGEAKASASSSKKKGSKAKEQEEQEAAEEDLAAASLKEILEARKKGVHKYPEMKMTMQGANNERAFKLNIKAGEFHDAEIIIMLGENGTGKTTFIRMLAGLLQPDTDEKGHKPEVPKRGISYKPQKIAPRFEGLVSDLLLTKMQKAFGHPQFRADVMKPMMIEQVLDQQVQTLSGGELQRVALTLCLGTPADIYLIDEPSAYLDSEQRIATCKMLKRFILSAKKTAFIVEHDFIMATYLADRVIVYEGQPGVEATANSPEDLLTGMNKFLEGLELTFRRDPTNFRPRINKFGSAKDTEQKKAGHYFFLDD